MKRLILVLFVVLAGFATAPTSVLHVLDHLTLTAVADAQQDPTTITVYVTRTGERYHRDGCRYLRQSKIATTLKEAVSRGYTPCSVCKPPTLQRTR